jgi:hypothetical protein
LFVLVKAKIVFSTLGRQGPYIYFSRPSAYSREDDEDSRNKLLAILNTVTFMKATESGFARFSPSEIFQMGQFKSYW